MITLGAVEIMTLLNMDASELDVPQRFAMFHEVSEYFDGRQDARHKVLALLGKHPGTDTLEAVWRYVRLQNEKLDVIKSLDPEQFDGYIANEIEHGIMSMKSIDSVEHDLKNYPDQYADIRGKLTTIKEINNSLQTYGD